MRNDPPHRTPARALPPSPLLAAALLVLGCSPAPLPPPAPHDSPAISASPPPPSPAPLSSTPLPCCSDFQAVQQADGQRVLVVGRYTPVLLMKRPGKPNPADVVPGKPATVAIELDSNMSLMLEIYHEPSGLRPLDEITRFAGKRVEIVGILHARTPSRRTADGEAQTMIGPYLGAIESMREAPP